MSDKDIEKASYIQAQFWVMYNLDPEHNCYGHDDMLEAFRQGFVMSSSKTKKAVADERGKWEKIIDLVIENKYEPDKWPKEVRDRMPMTLREAIRNRGKK